MQQNIFNFALASSFDQKGAKICMKIEQLDTFYPSFLSFIISHFLASLLSQLLNQRWYQQRGF